MPMSPSIAYFAGLHRPGMIPQPMAPQMQMPPQMGQQMPPQMPPQMMQQPQMPGMQPGMQPGQPPVGMPGMMQMNPQLLAQLAQFHGMGLGGMRQQMPMFGRPSIQPITSGAYSLR